MRLRWWRPKRTHGFYRNQRGEVLLLIQGPVPEGWKRLKKGEGRG